MKKHFNFQLMTFVSLLSVAMVVTTCKKSKETSPSAPTAITYPVTLVSFTFATLNGEVNAHNQSTIVTFDYDTTASYTQSINGTPDTLTGIASTYVSANLTGLKSSTLYHYRVRAVNSFGTTYGDDSTFTTSGMSGKPIIFNTNLTYGSVTDNDGNTYKTIQIGTQTWMAENLKTIKYNDGTSIPLVTDAVTWAELSTPGYCWYSNDSVTYGALYNWYTVNSGTLCPTGWHVPSDVEWDTLITFLRGDSIAGGILKETGTTHWQSPNAGATNESGYTALPGGYRNYDGTFNSIHDHGYWWSSTEYSSAEAYYRDMYYGYSDVDRSSSNQKSGFSVRCLKD